MDRGPAFTDRQVFEDIMNSITTRHGSTYQFPATIYGDMSRLVVAFLATTPPNQLTNMYVAFGWEGQPSARAIHEAAKKNGS